MWAVESTASAGQIRSCESLPGAHLAASPPEISTAHARYFGSAAAVDPPAEPDLSCTRFEPLQGYSTFDWKVIIAGSGVEPVQTSAPGAPTPVFKGEVPGQVHICAIQKSASWTAA